MGEMVNTKRPPSPNPRLARTTNAPPPLVISNHIGHSYHIRLPPCPHPQHRTPADNARCVLSLTPDSSPTMSNPMTPDSSSSLPFPAGDAVETEFGTNAMNGSAGHAPLFPAEEEVKTESSTETMNRSGKPRARSASTSHVPLPPRLRGPPAFIHSPSGLLFTSRFPQPPSSNRNPYQHLLSRGVHKAFYQHIAFAPSPDPENCAPASDSGFNSSHHLSPSPTESAPSTEATTVDPTESNVPPPAFKIPRIPFDFQVLSSAAVVVGLHHNTPPWLPAHRSPRPHASAPTARASPPAVPLKPLHHRSSPTGTKVNGPAPPPKPTIITPLPACPSPPPNPTPPRQPAPNTPPAPSRNASLAPDRSALTTPLAAPPPRPSPCRRSSRSERLPARFLLQNPSPALEAMMYESMDNIYAPWPAWCDDLIMYADKLKEQKDASWPAWCDDLIMYADKLKEQKDFLRMRLGRQIEWEDGLARRAGEGVPWRAPMEFGLPVRGGAGEAAEMGAVEKAPSRIYGTAAPTVQSPAKTNGSVSVPPAETHATVTKAPAGIHRTAAPAVQSPAKVDDIIAKVQATANALVAGIQSTFKGIVAHTHDKTNDLATDTQVSINAIVRETQAKINGLVTGTQTKINGIVAETQAKLNGTAPPVFDAIVTVMWATIKGVVAELLATINGIVAETRATIRGEVAEVQAKIDGSLAKVYATTFGMLATTQANIDGIAAEAEAKLNGSVAPATQPQAKIKGIVAETQAKLHRFLCETQAEIGDIVFTIRLTITDRVAETQATIKGFVTKLQATIGRMVSETQANINGIVAEMQAKMNGPSVEAWPPPAKTDGTAAPAVQPSATINPVVAETLAQTQTPITRAPVPNAIVPQMQTAINGLVVKAQAAINGLVVKTQESINGLVTGTQEMIHDTTIDTQATINRMVAETHAKVSLTAAPAVQPPAAINRVVAGTTVQTQTPITKALVPNTIVPQMQTAINGLAIKAQAAINGLVVETQESINGLVAGTQEMINDITTDTQATINGIVRETQAKIDGIAASEGQPLAKFYGATAEAPAEKHAAITKAPVEIHRTTAPVVQPSTKVNRTAAPEVQPPATINRVVAETPARTPTPVTEAPVTDGFPPEIQVTVDDLCEEIRATDKDMLADMQAKFVGIVTEAQSKINGLVAETQGKLYDIAPPELQQQMTVQGLPVALQAKINGVAAESRSKINGLIVGTKMKINDGVVRSRENIDGIWDDSMAELNHILTQLPAESNGMAREMQAQIDSIVDETDAEINNVIEQSWAAIKTTAGEMQATIDSIVRETQAKLDGIVAGVPTMPQTPVTKSPAKTNDTAAPAVQQQTKLKDICVESLVKIGGVVAAQTNDVVTVSQLTQEVSAETKAKIESITAEFWAKTDSVSAETLVQMNSIVRETQAKVNDIEVEMPTDTQTPVTKIPAEVNGAAAEAVQQPTNIKGISVESMVKIDGVVAAQVNEVVTVSQKMHKDKTAESRAEMRSIARWSQAQMDSAVAETRAKMNIIVRETQKKVNNVIAEVPTTTQPPVTKTPAKVNGAAAEAVQPPTKTKSAVEEAWQKTAEAWEKRRAAVVEKRSMGLKSPPKTKHRPLTPEDLVKEAQSAAASRAAAVETPKDLPALPKKPLSPKDLVKEAHSTAGSRAAAMDEHVKALLKKSPHFTSAAASWAVEKNTIGLQALPQKRLAVSPENFIKEANSAAASGAPFGTPVTVTSGPLPPRKVPSAAVSAPQPPARPTAPDQPLPPVTVELAPRGVDSVLLGKVPLVTTSSWQPQVRPESPYQPLPPVTMVSIPPPESPSPAVPPAQPQAHPKPSYQSRSPVAVVSDPFDRLKLVTTSSWQPQVHPDSPYQPLPPVTIISIPRSESPSPAVSPTQPLARPTSSHQQLSPVTITSGPLSNFPVPVSVIPPPQPQARPTSQHPPLPQGVPDPASPRPYPWSSPLSSPQHATQPLQPTQQLAPSSAAGECEPEANPSSLSNPQESGSTHVQCMTRIADVVRQAREDAKLALEVAGKAREEAREALVGVREARAEAKRACECEKPKHPSVPAEHVKSSSAPADARPASPVEQPAREILQSGMTGMFSSAFFQGKVADHRKEGSSGPIGPRSFSSMLAEAGFDPTPTPVAPCDRKEIAPAHAVPATDLATKVQQVHGERVATEDSDEKAEYARSPARSHFPSMSESQWSTSARPAVLEEQQELNVKSSGPFELLSASDEAQKAPTLPSSLIHHPPASEMLAAFGGPKRDPVPLAAPKEQQLPVAKATLDPTLSPTNGSELSDSELSQIASELSQTVVNSSEENITALPALPPKEPNAYEHPRSSSLSGQTIASPALSPKEPNADDQPPSSSQSDWADARRMTEEYFDTQNRLIMPGRLQEETQRSRDMFDRQYAERKAAPEPDEEGNESTPESEWSTAWQPPSSPMRLPSRPLSPVTLPTSAVELQMPSTRLWSPNADDQPPSSSQSDQSNAMRLMRAYIDTRNRPTMSDRQSEETQRSYDMSDHQRAVREAAPEPEADFESTPESEWSNESHASSSAGALSPASRSLVYPEPQFKIIGLDSGAPEIVWLQKRAPPPPPLRSQSSSASPSSTDGGYEALSFFAPKHGYRRHSPSQPRPSLADIPQLPTGLHAPPPTRDVSLSSNDSNVDRHYVGMSFKDDSRTARESAPSPEIGSKGSDGGPRLTMNRHAPGPVAPGVAPGLDGEMSAGPKDPKVLSDKCIRGLIRTKELAAAKRVLAKVAGQGDKMLTREEKEDIDAANRDSDLSEDEKTGLEKHLQTGSAIESREVFEAYMAKADAEKALADADKAQPAKRLNKMSVKDGRQSHNSPPVLVPGELPRKIQRLREQTKILSDALAKAKAAMIPDPTEENAKKAMPDAGLGQRQPKEWPYGLPASQLLRQIKALKAYREEREKEGLNPNVEVDVETLLDPKETAHAMRMEQMLYDLAMQGSPADPLEPLSRPKSCTCEACSAEHAKWLRTLEALRPAIEDAILVARSRYVVTTVKQGKHIDVNELERTGAQARDKVVAEWKAESEYEELARARYQKRLKKEAEWRALEAATEEKAKKYVTKVVDELQRKRREMREREAAGETVVLAEGVKLVVEPKPKPETIRVSVPNPTSNPASAKIPDPTSVPDPIQIPNTNPAIHSELSPSSEDPPWEISESEWNIYPPFYPNCGVLDPAKAYAAPADKVESADDNNKTEGESNDSAISPLKLPVSPLAEPNPELLRPIVAMVHMPSSSLPPPKHSPGEMDPEVPRESGEVKKPALTIDTAEAGPGSEGNHLRGGVEPPLPLQEILTVLARSVALKHVYAADFARECVLTAGRCTPNELWQLGVVLTPAGGEVLYEAVRGVQRIFIAAAREIVNATGSGPSIARARAARIMAMEYANTFLRFMNETASNPPTGRWPPTSEEDTPDDMAQVQKLIHAFLATVTRKCLEVAEENAWGVTRTIILSDDDNWARKCTAAQNIHNELLATCREVFRVPPRTPTKAYWGYSAVRVAGIVREYIQATRQPTPEDLAANNLEQSRAALFAQKQEARMGSEKLWSMVRMDDDLYKCATAAAHKFIRLAEADAPDAFAGIVEAPTTDHLWSRAETILQLADELETAAEIVADDIHPAANPDPVPTVSDNITLATGRRIRFLARAFIAFAINRQPKNPEAAPTAGPEPRSPTIVEPQVTQEPHSLSASNSPTMALSSSPPTALAPPPAAVLSSARATLNAELLATINHLWAMYDKTTGKKKQDILAEVVRLERIAPPPATFAQEVAGTKPAPPVGAEVRCPPAFAQQMTEVGGLRPPAPASPPGLETLEQRAWLRDDAPLFEPAPAPLSTTEFPDLPMTALPDTDVEYSDLLGGPQGDERCEPAEPEDGVREPRSSESTEGEPVMTPPTPERPSYSPITEPGSPPRLSVETGMEMDTSESMEGVLMTAPSTPPRPVPGACAGETGWGWGGA
ncbi:hypothetical protein EJ06DRAFT_585771 [Trichodelitschia bisporula]|uniref:Uncharacterized protein n=1 Tax=Trichodelitschia bisporula TaxID=703511 RepID=A0A6G1HHT5_9PEZI|nr:hypothetical protein EJ06DRAFT_585771 [Trichodelitschia bisporula]